MKRALLAWGLVGSCAAVVAAGFLLLAGGPRPGPGAPPGASPPPPPPAPRAAPDPGAGPAPRPAPARARPALPAAPFPAAEKGRPTVRPEELLVRVLDPAAAGPFAGAVVVAEPLGRGPDPALVPQPCSAVTDAEGQAVLLLDPLVTAWRVRVTFPGRPPAVRRVEWTDGRWFAPLEVDLPPAGVIEGRVLDPDGLPVAGARVLLDGAGEERLLGDRARAGTLGRVPEARERADRLQAAVTGKEGEFRIEKVPAGRSLTLVALAEGHSPSPPRWDFAVPVKDLRAEVELRLRRETSLSVRFLGGGGIVSGEPIRAWVSSSLGIVPLEPEGFGFQSAAGLEPGSWNVLATPESQACATLPVQLPEGVRTVVDRHLQDGATLRGRVLAWDRSGVPGIPVEARADLPGGTAFVVVRETTANAFGEFEVRGLPESDLSFAVRGPATGFLFEQRPRTPPDVLSAPGGIRARLVLPKGSSFPRSRSPVVDAGVGWDSFLRRLEEPGNVTLDRKTGVLEARECFSGHVYLRIHVPGFATLSRTAAIPSGGTFDLGDLPLTPGLPLRGNVLDPHGRPQPGVRVTAWYPDGNALSTCTDARGRFAFGSLAAGQATLEFRDVAMPEARFALETRPIRIEAGMPALTQRLEEGGLLRVRVEEANEYPVSYAIVGVDPGGTAYRPVPQPFEAREAGWYVGRRPLGPCTVRVFGRRGDLLASAPALVRAGLETKVVVRLPE